VTTPSLEALQLYTRAAALLNGEHWLTLDPLRLTVSRASAAGASRYESAEALLREATRVDPTFASAWLLLAHVVWNRQWPSDAFLPFAERALALSTGASTAERYFIQGFTDRRRAQAERGGVPHLEAAVQAFEALLEIDPDHYWGLLELGTVYRELGRIEDAERVTFRALATRRTPCGSGSRPPKLTCAGGIASPFVPPSPAFAPIRSSLSPRPSGRWRRTWGGFGLWEAHDAWLDGDVARAVDALRAAERRWSGDGARWWLLQLAEAYQGLGRFADANLVAARLAPEYRDWVLANVAARSENEPEFRRLMTPELGRFDVLHNRTGMLTLRGWLDTTAWVLAERRRRGTPMTWPEERLDEGLLRVAQQRYTEGIRLLEPITAQPWSTNAMLLAYEYRARAHRAVGDRAAVIRLLEPLGPARAAAVTYTSRVHDWLRCRVLLAEVYREVGRRDDALRLAKEVNGLLAVADRDHPLRARVATLHRSTSRALSP
jgi:hypothetical protein